MELMSRRMRVSAVIALLRDRHGEATACKMARLERLKARRARSRKRFDFWTAVATEMQHGGIVTRTGFTAHYSPLSGYLV